MASSLICSSMCKDFVSSFVQYPTQNGDISAGVRFESFSWMMILITLQAPGEDQRRRMFP